MRLKFYLFSGHLDDDEKILYVAHRHPFVVFKASFKILLIGVLAPIVFYLFFPQFLMPALVWLGIGFIGFFYHYFDWYFDAWLITTMGVIDIERNGLFDRNSTRVDYHMIEGMAINISGFWNTIMNFGDITVDKLGARTMLTLVDAANPKRIERMVMRYQEQFVNEKSVRDHDALKGMLSEMIAYHIQSNKIKPPRR